MKEQFNAHSTKEIVRRILTQHEETRGNDNMLYYYFFLEEYGTTSLAEIKDFEYNKFASVSRLRQKIQNECPFLRPSEYTQERRRVMEENYRTKISKEL